jgi:hypothetical protein
LAPPKDPSFSGKPKNRLFGFGGSKKILLKLISYWYDYYIDRKTVIIIGTGKRQDLIAAFALSETSWIDH